MNKNLWCTVLDGKQYWFQIFRNATYPKQWYLQIDMLDVRRSLESTFFFSNSPLNTFHSPTHCQRMYCGIGQLGQHVFWWFHDRWRPNCYTSNKQRTRCHCKIFTKIVLWRFYVSYTWHSVSIFSEFHSEDNWFSYLLVPKFYTIPVRKNRI